MTTKTHHISLGIATLESYTYGVAGTFYIAKDSGNSVTLTRGIVELIAREYNERRAAEMKLNESVF